MGTRGPIPNRDNDLARARERKGGDSQSATQGVLLPVGDFPPNPEWHKVARMFWDSLDTSGMRDFYQDTDLAFAYFVCEEISGYFKPGIDRGASKKASEEEGHEVEVRYPERKLSGMTFTALISAMNSLGATEGDRRRMRIELQAPKDTGPSADVIAIASYMSDLEDE